MMIFYDVSENQTYFSFGREISYCLGIPFFSGGDLRSLPPRRTGDREVDEEEEEDLERYGRRPGDLLGGDLLKGDLLRGERRGEPRYQGDLLRRGEGPRRIGLRAPTGECLGFVIGRAGKVF